MFYNEKLGHDLFHKLSVPNLKFQTLFEQHTYFLKIILMIKSMKLIKYTTVVPTNYLAITFPVLCFPFSVSYLGSFFLLPALPSSLTWQATYAVV